MERKLKQVSLLIFIFLLSSCSAYKTVPYFQNLNHAGFFQEDITNYSPLKIQSGDILGINVNSINQEASSVFNTSLNRVNGNNIDNSLVNPVYGFKVDGNGEVQLPLVGNIKVLGLTTDEIAKQLTTNLLPYLKSPIVNVRVLNFKISVTGDVLRPDVYTIQNEHININEALTLAGDLNITAKRTNVLLIREQDGKRQFITIDLTKRELFESPYYYLHNNDILYIEPDKTKYDAVARSYRTTNVVISALSALSAVIVSVILIKNH